MPTDPVFALADHVCATRYEDLPTSAVSATKRDLLDTFGCALGGSGAPGIDALLKLHRNWGGREEAGLLLVGGRLPVHQAAMIHGAMAHALDYDDTLDEGGSIHPGASVLAATLAMADFLGTVSGKDAILAAALGLDVSCRIALAATLDRGWHRTAAIGIFGATAVAGKLLGLTREKLVHAFGIAYSQAAGNRQCILDGALTKRLQAGQASSGGILSALLAREDFTGAHGVFAGRFGFFELYQPNGYDLAPLTADLGTAFRGEMLSFKPYPCGRPQHAVLDAALNAREALGLDASAVIADVLVSTTAATAAQEFSGAAAKIRPAHIVEAQFALPFLIAACLRHGRLGIDQVADVADAGVLQLAARVRAEAGPAQIIVTMADGRVWAQQVRPPRGSPAFPMSDGERLEKFRDCAAHAMRTIDGVTVDRAASLLDDLEHAPDITALTRMFA